MKNMTTCLYLEEFFDGDEWQRDQLWQISPDGMIVTTQTIPPDDPSVANVDRLYNIAGPGIIGPGLIDLQVNGGGGVLLNSHHELDDIKRLCHAHMQEGTLGLAATIITDIPARWRMAVNNLATAIEEGVEGLIACHLEGPFLNPERPGTHLLTAIRQPEPEDWAIIERLSNRLPTMMTIAPECLALSDLYRLHDMDIKLFAGHSQCPEPLFTSLCRDGIISGVTHLFNAMPFGTARDPGLAACALANPMISFGLIADGHHVGPTFLRLALGSQQADQRAFLVSDAMPPASQHPPQSFTLYDQVVTVKNGRCENLQGGLAGAAMPLITGVQTLRSMGYDWPFIFALTARNPAKIIGQSPRHGCLKPGSRADFIQLDQQGNLLRVYCGGKVLRTTKPQ
jgi:N-acetylglucosamine-6-phosphate deacetylase